MRRPVMPVVLGLLFVLTVLGASAAAETAHGAGLRVNELQVVGRRPVSRCSTSPTWTTGRRACSS